MLELSASLAFAFIGVLIFAAQWLAWRINLPSIVFLLGSGIVFGPMLGVLDADALFGDLLFPFVSMSVAIILFEGSLTLRLKELRGTRSEVWRLLSLGVVVTWAVLAWAAREFVGFDWGIALLFGAIMVVTGPTVIGPMLRAMRPSQRVSSLLKWEGIVIDPLGAVLALIVLEVMIIPNGGSAASAIASALTKMLGLGFLVGCGAGYVWGIVLRRYWVPDYLQVVSTLLIVVAVFVVCDAIVHESGLVAVTVMGLWLGNMRGVRTDEILNFKESLSILLISGLFILLATRLDLTMLMSIGVPALLVFLVAQFIARPLNVLVSTVPGSMNWRERALLSWVAPRGIVAAAISALFALRLEEAGVPGAELLVPLSFSLIIGTVVWQGLTAPLIARALGVSSGKPTGVLIVGGNAIAREIGVKLKEAGFAVLLADSAWDNVRAARMASLPVYFGNVVSHNAKDRLELDGIGYLFGLSRRDELNALASAHYAHEFGVSRVFAIASGTLDESAAKHRPSTTIQGRDLFGASISFATLKELLETGAQWRQTTLSDEFSFVDLQAQEPYMLALLAWSEDKQLMIKNDNEDFVPTAGWTVLSLVSGEEGSGDDVVRAQSKVNTKESDRQAEAVKPLT